MSPETVKKMESHADRQHEELMSLWRTIGAAQYHIDWALTQFNSSWAKPEQIEESIRKVKSLLDEQTDALQLRCDAAKKRSDESRAALEKLEVK